MSQILTLELSDKIAIPSVSFANAIQQQANNLTLPGLKTRGFLIE